ncbi:MAG: hypothetical protein WBQ43_16845 [Terriglobales bacterium]
MFDESPSAGGAERKSLAMSLVAGLLIAGSCFALLFVVMAHLIPLFARFTESPYARLLPVVSTLLISVGGSLRYLGRRGRRVPARPRHP